MGQINEARKALLVTQLEHAVVEAKEDGYYSIFIPSGIREFNVVKAESEAEAKAKVLANLSAKIDEMSETPSTGDVTVEPDNIKKVIKATVRPATEEEING